MELLVFENATGAVIGLRSSTDTIDIVQAALESVAYRFAEIFDRFKGITFISEAVASGGALRESPVWTQIIADTLGRDLTLPDTREASSRGAVLLALETIGKIERIEALPTQKGTAFAADKKRRKVYGIAREQNNERYRQLIND